MLIAWFTGFLLLKNFDTVKKLLKDEGSPVKTLPAVFLRTRSRFATGNHPAKLKHLLPLLLFLTTVITSSAQSFSVKYIFQDTDSIQESSNLLLQKAFASRPEADEYIVKLPSLLREKGFLTASVDSVQYDSVSAWVFIFLGDSYKWSSIKTSPLDAELLKVIHFPENIFTGKVDFVLLKTWQRKILDYLEENGHPFGKSYLDSIEINRGEVNAILHIDRGPLYKVDSIKVHGNAKVSNEFLQRYLDIPNGSFYNKRKLENISKRIAESNFLVEEKTSDLTLLGSGSILNIYLKSKKNSQANVLVGFLPNSDQLPESKKILLTIDANILLRNALGSGETIGLVWQQLQQKSPRLNLLFEQPYIFHSSFGFQFSLDMYKRDSNFLNINMNLGTSYRIGEKKTASLFLQRRQTIVSSINESVIIQSKKLPQDADVSSINLGVGYNFNNTDYRFNPSKGNEFNFSSSAGTKKIRKNNQVLELKDPSNPSYKFESLYDTVKLKAYQFRVAASGAQYFSLGGQSTLKLGLNSGVYQSANYFRNELFQIGGIKLLRGFDEESQFVSRYAIGTMEYRYRIDLNSYFFAFADGGWGKHLLETKSQHAYFGTGIGMSLETKAGIINLAWAVGKRDDTKFNLRQSKVHLGFASYF